MSPVRSAAVALAIAASVAAGACAPSSSRVAVKDLPTLETAFTFPLLSFDELVDLFQAAELPGAERSTLSTDFARVVCAAKGYRVGGDAFGRCATTATAATADHREALVRAWTLGEIAHRIAKLEHRRHQGSLAGPRRATLCYDLSMDVLTECEDV